MKIVGTLGSSPVTVLGTHMDSINLNSPTSGCAPGADDDGTGSVNMMEALRIIVDSGFKLSTPLEFHWCSGEEADFLDRMPLLQATGLLESKLRHLWN